VVIGRERQRPVPIGDVGPEPLHQNTTRAGEGICDPAAVLVGSIQRSFTGPARVTGPAAAPPWGRRRRWNVGVHATGVETGLTAGVRTYTWA